jgi:DNA-3-methyladenine glycosylase
LSFNKILNRTFYTRDSKDVAIDLLGKILVRRVNERILEGIIVETEAYYGLHDPASRAYSGIKRYNRLMWDEPGKVFIYNVHKYWMLNLVAHKPEAIGAVLIRAIEPIKGIEEMLINRPVKKIINLSNGPGKLTLALNIDKRCNGVKVTSCDSAITILNSECKPTIMSSHRIGVKKDLKKKLRFFIKGNNFVSRK